MIKYICPECGAKVNVLCLTSLPHIYRYKCSKCSYEYEDGSDITQDEIITWTMTLNDSQNKPRGYTGMLPQEYFYTAKPITKNVTKEEFMEFIKNYPRKLERDVCGISDPPAVSYNDFELANRWPYSIAASTFLYDDNPDDYFYEPEDKRTYCIVVNHEELFESKTGKMAD